MKKPNIKNVIFLISVILLLSGTFIVPGLGQKQDPKSSQAVVIDIVVTDEQIASVYAGLTGFQQSPLSNGISAVNVISSGTTAEAQLSFIQTRLAAGDTDLDIIGMDVIWTAQFVENNWVINLDSLLETNEMDDYVGGMVDSCEYQGSYYAYPWFFNLGVLYYRKDLLNDNGFTVDDIDTWEELNATANAILASNSSDIPGLVGYTAQMANYEGGTVNFIEWIGANGATTIVDNEGNFNTTKPEMIEAMAFLKNLIAPAADTDLATTDYIIDRTILTSREGESGDKWLAGEAIFLRNWPYIYDLSLSADNLLNVTDGSGNPVNWGLTAIPTFGGATGAKSSCVGGQILGISSNTPYQQAALNVTRYLCDNYSQYLALEQYSHFPTLKETYSDLPDNLLYAQAFYNASGSTLARPKHEDYTQVSDVISDRFSEIISCQSTAQAGLTAMQQDIESVLTPVPDIIPGFELSLVLILLSSVISVIIIVNRKKFKN